MKVSQAETRLP